MKRQAFLNKFISLSIVLIAVLSLCTLHAFAAPGDTPYDNSVPYAEGDRDTPIADGSVPDDVQTAPVPIEQEPIYEYIYGYDEDVTTGYEEPEHLQELPQVNQGEVIEATAVVIPDVAVSDASLFSGIVMWLCVALGIAVLVGVLVSKRTMRRGL